MLSLQHPPKPTSPTLAPRPRPQESGVVNWRRVPALNTAAPFIEDLADAVIEALPHAGHGMAAAGARRGYAAHA